MLPLHFSAADVSALGAEAAVVDDGAYLEEFVHPKLLPVLIELADELEKKGVVPDSRVSETEKDTEGANFNCIRWIAQRLMRARLPGIDKSAYEEKLEAIAAARREQRLLVEAVAQRRSKEAKTKAAEDKFCRDRRENELAIESDRLLQEQRAARVAALETSRSQRLATLVESMTQDASQQEQSVSLATKAAELRDSCSRLIESLANRLVEPGLLEALEDAIQAEVAMWVCSNSPASYVAVAHLAGETQREILHRVAAAAREEELPVDMPPDEAETGDSDAGGEELPEADIDDAAAREDAGTPPPPPRPERVRRIERMTLPAAEEVEAYLVPKGSVTYRRAVKRRNAVLVTDAKAAEGLIFFDGQKRSGSYAAVPWSVGDVPVEPPPAPARADGAEVGEGDGLSAEEEPGEDSEEEELEEEAEGGGDEDAGDGGVVKVEAEAELPLVFGVLCMDTFDSLGDDGTRARAHYSRFANMRFSNLNATALCRGASIACRLQVLTTACDVSASHVACKC